jgi:hypothetical protein
MSGIANYVQHPIDKKYYLFFNTPKLKEWSPKSDIVLSKYDAGLNYSRYCCKTSR